MEFEAVGVVVCDTGSEFIRRVEHGVFDTVVIGLDGSIDSTERYHGVISSVMRLIGSGGCVCVLCDVVSDAVDVRLGSNNPRCKKWEYSFEKEVCLDNGDGPARMCLYRKCSNDGVRLYDDICRFDIRTETLDDFWKVLVCEISNKNGVIISFGVGGPDIARWCIGSDRKFCIVSQDRDYIDSLKRDFFGYCFEALRCPVEHDKIPADSYNVSECLRVSKRNPYEPSSDPVPFLFVNDGGEKVVLPYKIGWTPKRVEKREYQTDFSELPY